MVIYSEVSTLKLLLYVLVHRAGSAVHSMFCRIGIRTGTYNRNFQGISMDFFLFFLRKLSQLHALLEPPHLLTSEKPATNIVLYVINIKKNPTYMAY